MLLQGYKAKEASNIWPDPETKETISGLETVETALAQPAFSK